MPTSECSECGGSVQYEVSNLFPASFRPTMCDLCFSRRQKARKEEEFKHRLHGAGIPTEYWSFDSTMPTANHKLLAWCKLHGKDSIHIGGLTGLGKTRCLCRLMVLRLWHDWGLTGSYIAMVDWVRQVTTAMGQKMALAEEEISRAKRVGVLLMDDLGQEKLTERGAEVVFALIDGRLRSGRTIWVTTNATPQEFDERFGRTMGQAIRRRLAEHTWEWKRGRSPLPKRKKDDTFFSALEDDAL